MVISDRAHCLGVVLLPGAVAASADDWPTLPDYTITSGKNVHRVDIDHRISRELAGADDVDDLWPECYEVVDKDKHKQADGAYKKVPLENKLHNLVCAANSADRAALLSEYQRKIADNLIALYHEIHRHARTLRAKT